MRYKQFLNEGRSKAITQDVAFETIKDKCKNAYKAYTNNQIIYRGYSNYMGQYAIIDPKSGKPRKSANTSNHYTILIDNSPNWKGYPKRSQSLICSNSYGYSKGYGKVYEVFPYDQGTKIGICPERDFWFSFEEGIGETNSLDYFNFALARLLRRRDIEIDISKFTAHTQYTNALDFADTQLRKKDLEVMKDEIDPILKSWNYKKDTLKQHINDILDPNKNGFKVVNDARKIPKVSKGDGQEMWTDTKCVLIESSLGLFGDINPHLKDYMES